MCYLLVSIILLVFLVAIKLINKLMDEIEREMEGY